MAEERPIYGEVENTSDLERIFSQIRGDVESADSRAALTELHRRAGYLITLTHAPSWEKKFGKEVTALRKEAQDEFRKTAQKINQRARQVGTEANYDESWGG